MSPDWFWTKSDFVFEIKKFKINCSVTSFKPTEMINPYRQTVTSLRTIIERGHAIRGHYLEIGPESFYK